MNARHLAQPDLRVQQEPTLLTTRCSRVLSATTALKARQPQQITHALLENLVYAEMPRVLTTVLIAPQDLTASEAVS